MSGGLRVYLVQERDGNLEAIVVRNTSADQARAIGAGKPCMGLTDVRNRLVLFLDELVLFLDEFEGDMNSDPCARMTALEHEWLADGHGLTDVPLYEADGLGFFDKPVVSEDGGFGFRLYARLIDAKYPNKCKPEEAA